MSFAAWGGWTLIEWLLLIERELLLFALFWFLIGMVDELAVDAIWFCMRLKPGFRTPYLSREVSKGRLDGRLAVFVACWQEADVIGATVANMLRCWRENEYILYIGCYCNDPATVAAITAIGGSDPRLRIVIHDKMGPTTKADCLNRIYKAMCADELRLGYRFKGVVLHDSEDMVHPLELMLIDRALSDVEFVQLPVRPETPEGGHWVAGHYCDEFAEAHARAMPVRDALGAGLPAAGVSCGFSRDMLEQIGEIRMMESTDGPFAADCLTEDYELGMLIPQLGGRGCFLRCRDADGHLIGTRSYFPNTVLTSVRQKTRWMHGICLQGWDRLGWNVRLVDLWMMIRDRRGPLIALVLFAAYILLLVEGVLGVIGLWLGKEMPQLAPPPAYLNYAMKLCVIGLIWRSFMRGLFTGREYGWREGLLAPLRLPVANVVMILAARRAIWAYCRSLRGARVVWDKTEHMVHPSLVASIATPPLLAQESPA
ncbi:glycosyl transferase family protein [Novosphingobium sp. KACC 22771]|uniref:glycosyl transferase family protein n=1 Tax=Novosphingobium sp. KACC 22771 TaxID=3025670 RepID=UPI002366600C|nr:glycosyl transferase family protein [Novosphingobium sp. KACC 22771]WDF73771.1 glycosyl transferase family protein [Novosphingobium sp. KACC 22771]